MIESDKFKVLFVDDDIFTSSLYSQMLSANSFTVDYFNEVDKALAIASYDYDAIVLDVMMPFGEKFNYLETAGGHRTGIELCKEIMDRCGNTIIVALTNSKDAHVKAWFESRDNFSYCFKGDVTSESFPHFLKNKILGVSDMPKVFIVHGHDTETAISLKNYLQNTLNLPEPTILAEKPSLGMTVIEKFEHYASQSDVVFALFTPDDLMANENNTKRARQNVLFEYGYFLGHLGRRNGRVFLLYKQGVELPSDLHGLVYIDITGGVAASGEDLRRELHGVFNL